MKPLAFRQWVDELLTLLRGEAFTLSMGATLATVLGLFVAGAVR